MKRLIFTTLLISATVMTGFAQVGIGTPTPNASSILDLTSTSKALLLPRLTTTQRDAITSAVAGMVIFNTTTNCMEIFTTNGWFNVCNGTTTGGLPPVDGDTSSNQVAKTNLIAHWTFDGTTTEITHSVVPTLSGGTVTYTTGKIGQAAHFNNAWLTYPAAATGAGSNNTGFNSNDTLQHGATVTLWEQVPDTSQLTTLFQLSVPAIANWPLFGIQYRKHPDTTIDLDGGLANVDGTGTHPSYQNAFGPSSVKDNGIWGFVTMVYDTTAGGRLLYYFNGAAVGSPVSVATGSGAAQIFPSPESLLLVAPNYASIGAAEGEGYTPGSTNTPAPYMSYGITGNIDDIRFFNTALTAQQVSDLYQLGNQGR
jgi:hypothetical protein